MYSTKSPGGIKSTKQNQLFVYHLLLLTLLFDPCVNKHMFSCHLAFNGCITAISEKLDFATEEFATYFHTNEGVLNGMKNHSLMSCI